MSEMSLKCQLTPSPNPKVGGGGGGEDGKDMEPTDISNFTFLPHSHLFRLRPPLQRAIAYAPALASSPPAHPLKSASFYNQVREH